jgi:putative aldouronate transport system permease protein
VKSSSYDYRGNDKVFMSIVYILVIIISIAIVVPLLYVLLTSFATKQEMMTRGFFIIPHEWTLNSYNFLIRDKMFVQSFMNSVYITVVGTTINMVFTSLMAYGLSKSWLKGRNFINFIVVFSMLFNGGMIPLYLVVKNLHMLDSYWAIFLTVAIAPFNLIIMRTFFQSLPAELEEAARIDGCGEMRLLWNIVIPASMPIIATFTLFYAVEHWNNYFNAILYLNDSSRWPLQVYLRQMLISPSSDMGANESGFEYSPSVRMAAVVITALPLLLVYPFMQKHFDKGLLLGSVKG